MATEDDEACNCGEALRPVKLASSWGDRLPTPPPLAESDGMDDDGDTM
jgi:hypothetical protein